MATVADARNGGPEANLCKCVRAGLPTIGLKCLLAGGVDSDSLADDATPQVNPCDMVSGEQA
ncbi:unnamed protein product [Clonostachys solani]|uniref:Uncharacterized protein n=1 Tax=Clonostachys solani TaxID=160281 RepID=A0A9N9W3M5_9HYPO|nr:unnamed protein product [Clonostachys solani]